MTSAISAAVALVAALKAFPSALPAAAAIDGFKGAAGFGVAPDSQGLLVAAPDLVRSKVRFNEIARQG